MAMEATEYAFPFDAEPCEEGFDREYIADDFARYFRAFITSGIIADGGNIAESLQVVANGDMTTTLKKGNLMIDGYRYELMEDMIFHHTAADGVLDRIDRISVTLDTAEREIHAIVKEGEYSYKPVAPQCRRNSEHLDYVVADVRVVAGAIKIAQANITDTRLSTELCGVAFPFWKLDTQPFFVQLNSFYNEFVAKSDRSYQQFQEWQDDKKEEIEGWQAAEEKQTDDWQKKKTDDFTAWMEGFINQWESWLLGETKGWQEEIIDWFNNLREQLTENAAVSLQTQIGNLNKLETEDKDDLVSAINSLTLSYDETMAVLAGVKTVTLTLSANDGADVDGQSVTLLNVATGEDTVMEYSGEGITFEVFGDVEYILTVEDMEEHISPDPVKVAIVEGDTLGLNMEYRLSPLNDLSWETIIRMSESGKADGMFSLHDTKEIELTTGEKIEVEIVGFYHDINKTEVDGNGNTAHEVVGITFGMKDCLVTNYRMNPTNTNVGGWRESEMRTAHIRQHLYDVLPEDLKAGIKKVNKITSVGNKGTAVEVTEDDVWLFSLAELGVTGLGTPYSQEGTAYPAFTSNTLRVKRGGTGGTARYYFTRSPYAANTTQFRCITTSGGSSYANAGTTGYGMAVGFCV